MGRTGKMWGHEWDGVVPDLMSSAKALANGYPMGALLASEEVGSHLTPGSHASTFGGNALGAAVALRSLQLIGEALPNARRGSAPAWPRGSGRSAPAAGWSRCAAAACCWAWC